MIKVREQSHATARSGKGTSLEVTAQKGDVLLFVLSSQWGTVGRKTVPAGWQHVYADGPATAGRSGFIAWTRATQTTKVRLDHWWGEVDTYAARQNGLLLAISGVAEGAEPITEGWVKNPPTQVGPGLVITQQHASRWNPLDEFTVSNGQVIWAGEASKELAWSSLRAVLNNTSGTVKQGKAGATVIWATIGLEPAGPNVDVAVANPDGTAITPTASPLRSTTPETVESLLARKRWMIAHRGGSADWPEMSLRAYTESARRKVSALEFSFSITKDDVMLGLHDQTLKRVDSSAPDTPITQMTAAEAQKYRTFGQPLIKLQTLLTAFGNDKVLFVDPKYSPTRHQLYLPLLDPKRTIMKYYGDATWLATIWRNAGFKCWGFMYPEEILDGRGATWAPYWDLVGVPWYADKKVWEIARSYGKPLVGHICPDQKAIDRSFEMGAVGVMCAKIDGMVLR
ncbi:cytoplasmic glycerophosphodiester phosphodiesterase [Actinomyces bovis]|uniref:Cytoplasmic glycerophosphodiester phosphodiesterase n=1 Tax=Actinomyces bovis TaxID=1658 RepID=A0ABY1VMG7_9ACTO|nr:glycerophosphodiester phosphodiesterase family protein [Actinomyces bovis]SPT53124.1 cytoplasmic glycerophosphodiester phosphodiesterase [Actinomyces bovis]VEG52268.1 cytoplasmic glycerophosphodiester phosphodiesterase [Actinomyces israelii]